MMVERVRDLIHFNHAFAQHWSILLTCYKFLSHAVVSKCRVQFFVSLLRSKFVEEFADGLKEISLKDLAPPSFALPLVTPHLTRLLNAQVLVQIEDKVQRLTTPSTANANLASFAITSISVVDSSSTISNLTNSWHHVRCVCLAYKSGVPAFSG